MGTPLKALIAEDDDKDCELLLIELRKGGFEVTWRRVETYDTMREALTNETWDIIFSDYSMPEFSGTAALLLVFEMDIVIPFFIVSGTIGEDLAVEAMRAGAQDYFIKGRLARLAPAVERELRDAAERREKKKLKEELLFADRMATVGTLAAGVAHEVNNPLSAVIANVDCALDALKEFEAEARASTARADTDSLGLRWDLVRDPLIDAREAGTKIRDIVRDLKLFSRPGRDGQGAVSLARVLDSAARMAWVEVRYRVRLVKEYADAPLVEGNGGRLGQVFLNLILNAAHAISEGAVEKNEIRLVTGETDGRAFAEVRDTGPGISPDVIGKIWDPFFSTRSVGQGTGLGLSISRSIVTGLRGEISVKSEVGRGTVFRVVLPGAHEREVPAPLPSVAPVVTRRARLLVVDDEENVARAIRRVLASEHDVATVTGGAEALRLLKASEPFDVILCDLMMPDVSGMALYNDLAQTAPDLTKRIIFMTGGIFTSAARAFLDRVANPRIEKPFDYANLRHLVASIVR